MTKLERLAAGAIATTAIGAIALQSMINEGSALIAFAMLFRFFTIWSNFAAGLAMGWVALGRRLPDHVSFALTSALAVVALVYHALLAPDHHPVGLDWWTNLAFHTVVPASTISWWLMTARFDTHAWSALPFAMVAPVIYTCFALVYGAASGFYPYFFLDRSELGWPQLLLNIAGLSLFFLLIGAAMMGLRALAARLVTSPA